MGSLELRNRLVMAPMTRNYSPNNIPDDQVAAYYGRRAKGGIGMIITEGTCVGHRAANASENVPFMYGSNALAGWKAVVDEVHHGGAAIAAQLWHVGAVRSKGVSPYPQAPGIAPSGIEMPEGNDIHEMTTRDIEDVIEAFRRAAVDAKGIGFDAIEIHGAHGYLIDQFFWSQSNRREDRYGGSLLNRASFAAEIVSEIRRSVGVDFPIIFRWSQWKEQDLTTKLVECPNDLAVFLQPLVDAGVDMFHCSTHRYWEPEFDGSSLNLAGWTKKLTGKPTITVGSIGLGDKLPEDESELKRDVGRNLKNLVHRLKCDEFDLAAVGRPVIANPSWANIVKEGRYTDLMPYRKSLLNSLY